TTGPFAMTGTFGAGVLSTNVSASIAAYTTPALHDLCVQGTDIAGNPGNIDCIVLAGFDPNGSFTTGGGGLAAHAGSDLANPTTSGPVTFGFNVKYLPGTTTPAGSVEFHYNAGNINFHSTGFDFLVATTSPLRAQVQGTGTINGTSTCKFTV